MDKDVSAIIDQHGRVWAGEVKQNILVYPDPPVISFLSKLWGDARQNAGKHALDVGFGSGRHLAALADYGFDTHGLEISQATIDVATELLGRRGVTADLRLQSLEAADFGDSFFDVVVYYGAAFLSPIDNMRQCLMKLHRMIKPGGGMVVNFRSPDSWTYGLGRCLQGSTFELDSRAGPYANAVYTFLTSAEASALLQECGFKVLNAERYEQFKNNESERHCWTVFWVGK